MTDPRDRNQAWVAGRNRARKDVVQFIQGCLQGHCAGLDTEDGYGWELLRLAEVCRELRGLK